jgi:glycopeptide antibiotics resistance protein
MYYYLRNLKYEYVVVAFVILFGCSLLLARKGVNVFWCFGYSLWMTIVLVVTILGRDTDNLNNWTSLFASFIALANHNQAIIYDLFFNIVLYIPGGFLLRLKMGNIKALKIVILTTFWIETLQLVTGRGVFEISDLMTNTLGGIIGIMVVNIKERKL